MAQQNSKDDCIFCNIISGKNSDAKFVYRVSKPRNAV